MTLIQWLEGPGFPYVAVAALLGILLIAGAAL